MRRGVPVWVGGWECSGCHPGFLGLSVQLGGLMAI